jgi:hypothetical protein
MNGVYSSISIYWEYQYGYLASSWKSSISRDHRRSKRCSLSLPHSKVFSFKKNWECSFLCNYNALSVVAKVADQPNKISIEPPLFCLLHLPIVLPPLFTQCRLSHITLSGFAQKLLEFVEFLGKPGFCLKIQFASIINLHI